MNLFELTAKIFNEKDFPAVNVILNILIAIISGIKNDTNRKLLHAKIALYTAIKYDYIFLLAMYFDKFQDVLPIIGDEFPDNFYMTLKEENIRFSSNIKEFKKLSNEKRMLEELLKSPIFRE